MHLIVKLLVNCIALVCVVKVVPGIAVDSMGALIAAAIMLGVLNTFLKPMLVLVTLPLSILSLGLFTLVINGILFYLCGVLITGFMVHGFWAACWGALLFSIVSTVLSWFTGGKSTVQFRTNFQRPAVRNERPTPGRGTVIDVEAQPYTADQKDPPALS
jgi:putative membrane protein